MTRMFTSHNLIEKEKAMTPVKKKDILETNYAGEKTPQFKLSNVVFKCLLILGPKCYFGSELRYSNEITLYQRNLAFRSEMSHFASELTLLRPNSSFRT